MTQGLLLFGGAKVKKAVELPRNLPTIGLGLAPRGKPKPDRRKISRQFHRFFDLRPSEQEKALSHLPRRERAKMEASLERFKAMSTAQRELVIMITNSRCAVDIALKRSRLASILARSRRGK